MPSRRLPEWTLHNSVATRYLTPDRAQGVIALLLSEEVYIDHDGFWERVSVTTGDKIPAKVTQPININLAVSHIADAGFMPDLERAAYGDPRLPNQNFNETFN